MFKLFFVCILLTFIKNVKAITVVEISEAGTNGGTFPGDSTCETLDDDTNPTGYYRSLTFAECQALASPNPTAFGGCGTQTIYTGLDGGVLGYSPSANSAWRQGCLIYGGQWSSAHQSTCDVYWNGPNTAVSANCNIGGGTPFDGMYIRCLCTTASCGENENVVSGACQPCAAGSTNVAGDDPGAGNTNCDVTACAINERVSSNACVACTAGTQNAAGDLATGADTACDPYECIVDPAANAGANDCPTAACTTRVATTALCVTPYDDGAGNECCQISGPLTGCNLKKWQLQNSLETEACPL